MTRVDGDERLRSESTPAPGRVARVVAARARAQRDRAAMAGDFRDRLTREVGNAEPSTSEEALIDCAVSARVEIAVVTGRFLRCCATEAEMDRLQLARGVLTRSLRLLGLPKRQDEPSGIDGIGAAPGPDASPEVRQAWSKRYVAACLAEGKEAL